MEEQAPVETPEEEKWTDAGNVMIVMNGMPIPLPAVFEQLFGILGHIDQRLIKLEAGKRPEEEDRRIITV